MSIYRRCPKCHKDNPRKSTKCCKCFTKLISTYRVLYKNPHTGKWLTKTTKSLRDARDVEYQFRNGGSSDSGPPIQST
jgi:hypothetical protein